MNVLIGEIPKNSVYKNELKNNFRNKLIIKTTLNNLKKICKIIGIRNYSKLKKEEIMLKIEEYYSVIKIQRWFRKNFSSEKICSISLDPIRYPCFPYRPKGHKFFIYYNLESLIDYLLTTGDFRDPKTREKYDEDTLKKIDKMKKNNKIKGKNVLYAYKHKGIYKKKKAEEDRILVLERCLDNVVSTIRKFIRKQ